MRKARKVAEKFHLWDPESGRIPARAEFILAMHTTYVAYGLQLRSSFALPGMPMRSATGLPSLAIERATEAQLEDTWSRTVSAPEWRGVLGDGCPLTIERGLEGDLLFTYAHRARFHLDAAKITLTCVPAEADLHWQQVLLGRILPNVGLERGYEALHASAVESPEGVVAILAPSGMGKTTLAIELMRRGWPLFADDVVVLTGGGGELRAHAGAPLMNVATDRIDEQTCDELGSTLAVLAGERWLAADSASEGDRRVRMVCLFERAPGLTLDVRKLPSSPLPLAPYMLGLPGDRERERSRFSLFADLMDSAELVKLTCSTNDPPEELADLLEDTLRSPAALVMGGAS